MPAVGQKAIAERLGVSVATVSRALRNAPSIPPTTRARVLEVAQELGYRGPRTVGERRAPSQTHTLGVWAYRSDRRHEPEAGRPQVVRELLEGVATAASLSQAQVHFRRLGPGEAADLLNDPSRDAERRMQISELSGVVLLLAHRLPDVEAISKLLPCVAVNNKYPGLDLDAVLADADTSFDTLVGRLQGRGHRRIGFLHGGLKGWWGQERFVAYARALLQRGLPFDPAAVVGLDAERPTLPDQIDRVTKLIQQGVCAWVCSNDQAAYDLQALLVQRGLRVPEDVSITGYDGLETPEGLKPLSTVQVPFRELGAAAVERLSARLADRFGVRRSIQVAGTVRDGETIGPGPEHA